MGRDDRRFERQMEALSRDAPAARRFLHALRHGPLRYLRIPLGVLLIVGGFLGMLPVLGFWMIPLGLMLLAIDIPLLRPVVGSAILRLRRMARRWTGKGNGERTARK